MSRAEPVAPFEQLSAERFEAVIDTNIYGVVNITRGAVPHMRRRRNGCILQILSVGGRLTRLGSTPYHAAKWAVGGFAEPLAQELSPFGMKVCALEPGGMRTNWGVQEREQCLLGSSQPKDFCLTRSMLATSRSSAPTSSSLTPRQFLFH